MVASKYCWSRVTIRFTAFFPLAKHFAALMNIYESLAEQGLLLGAGGELLSRFSQFCSAHAPRPWAGYWRGRFPAMQNEQTADI